MADHTIRNSGLAGVLLGLLLSLPTVSLGQPARAAETIKIGWSGPLSGNSAVLGIDSAAAVGMVVDEINTAGGIRGRRLELLVEDDQYDTAKAVSAYARLQRAGVLAVIASTYGGVFATARQAERDQIAVINPLDCNEAIAKLSGPTFCIATQSESVGVVIAQALLDNGSRMVGIIYDEKNPFMSLVGEVIEQSLKGKLGVSSQGVEQNSVDFRPLLVDLKSKGADAIVFLGHDPMGTAMRVARDLGSGAQFYTVGTITSPGFQKLAGAAAEGTLVAFWEAPRSEAYLRFVEAFTKRVGRAPILELATIPSYDTAQVLVKALQAAVAPDGRVERAALVAALLKTNAYQGLSGRIDMDADGAVRTIRESLYRVTGGQLQPGKQS